MAGRKGRSGRKRIPAEVHAARGTYRADRHGPLPDGVTPVVIRGAFSGVSRRPSEAPSVADVAPPMPYLTAEDCPAILTPEGATFWEKLITARPTEKVYEQAVATYVQAWETWQRAVRLIQSVGDVVRQGEGKTARPIQNPNHAIRRDAEKTMLDVGRFLGWQSKDAASDRRGEEAPTVTRLEAFLASRNGR